MLQALQTEESAARAMQAKQKKAVHWEPWQSPVKGSVPSMRPTKLVSPDAIRQLRALKEEATKKLTANTNEKSGVTKAAPPRTLKRN